MRRHSFLALGLSFAASCTLGPDYVRPEVPLPEGWRSVEAAESESLANLTWWELFSDPVLRELIGVALEENKDLAIAVERIEEARALYGFTRAELLPMVDGVAGGGQFRRSRIGVPTLPDFVDNSGTLYGVGVTAFWELDFFGRIRRATEAQLALLYATEEARRAVVIALVADVARAYVELRNLDQSLALSRETLRSRDEYVELARVRFEGGRTSELDWRQAEAEYHRTAALVHDFEQRVQQKENELSVLLGRNPGEIPRGLVLRDMPLPPAVPAGLPSSLLERRPDVRQAEEQLVAANAAIGEAKALLYPSIALTGSFGWESKELSDLLTSPAQSWGLGLNLLQPIFNAGQNKRRVEVAESRQRQALSSYELSILQAFRDVEDSLVTYRKSGERRLAQSARVEAQQKVLELSEARYQGGVAAYLEVLDAQRTTFQAELDELQARQDVLLGLIRLYKALGGGWIEQASAPQAQDAGSERGEP